ncbi:hypothetical protein REPUB_Repub05bG0032500 [Reevesia pubescens]
MLWSENLQSNCRVIWVACYGIPIHAWTLETFQNIAERWGDFVKMDSVTLEMNGFSKGCLQISTTLLSRIEDSFDLQVGDKLFSVKAIEISHDCEFTGPCCYEELNWALRKLGLDSVDIQSNGEADSNGGEVEESVPLEKEMPAWQERQIDLPRWNSDKVSPWVEITINNTGIPAAGVDVEALKVIGNVQNIDGAIEHAQLLSRSCLTVVNSRKSLVTRPETSDRTEKGIEDRLIGLTSMEMELDCQGNTTIDLNCFGPATEEDLSKALVVWTDGRLKEIEDNGLYNGWPGNLIRATEDVLNMGLFVHPTAALNREASLVEVEDALSGQINREARAVVRVSKARKSKKWRWVKEVAEEEDFFRKNISKGKKNKKKFKRTVMSFNTLSEEDKIANHSISDGDFQRRAEGYVREEEEEVTSATAKEIWEFGKQLGFAHSGNEDLVLRKLCDRIRVVRRKNYK